MVVMGGKVYNIATNYEGGFTAAPQNGNSWNVLDRLVQREQFFPSRYDQSYSPFSPALPGGMDYKTAQYFLKDNGLFPEDSSLFSEDNILFSEDASQNRNLLEDAEREQIQEDQAMWEEWEKFEMESDDVEKSLQPQKLDDIIITKNGLEIDFNSKHVIKRKIERGISTKDVKDALILPLDIGEIEYDPLNRPSQKFIGKHAIVVVNPEDGTIVTAWKTTKKTREEYMIW